MRNAILAIILAGVACGFIGSYVVVRRIVFMSGGVSHATFGGIGLGLLLGIDPSLTAIPFGLASALLAGLMSRRAGVSEDTAIGVVWASGMALGILFSGMSEAHAPDLVSYLFGSILMVGPSDLGMMLSLDLIIVSAMLLLYKEILSISFDEEFSIVVGVPAGMIYYLSLCLVALSVVVLMKVVGIVLAIALLSLPPAIALRFSSNFKGLITLSIATSIAIGIAGMAISYILDLPSGAAMVITLAASFGLSRLIRIG